ncbi:DUF2169 domain-containing protein [Corallococcus sp. bb12-1]|uniref:DUF2169 family type VI secretion system accessory protein n=1 Tax=Corallococcus sp. bb12-1 TaxID=2996784 RepID=UPI00226F5767|nr:DUF2169 domain-containing protein [Corallococcus sp. bb12-1]MCY1046511.1 DUF2169 domain-containing protein [Corallococcus sp. bb12-1]
MGHPVIQNRTPFVFEPLFLADEETRPLLVPVVKATFLLGASGALKLAPQQTPLCPQGERWEETDTSSYRYEPEGAFFKTATDVALVGHAHAPRPGTRELEVSLQVGALRKDVKVVGERSWFKNLGSVEMTRPLPFERIPLRYERAFGGWDRSRPEQPQFEPRNPVGLGFRIPGRPFEEGERLPNLEDPAEPLRGWGHRPPPAGFGFIGAEWQPRAAFAGTYDAAWTRDRKPRLPRDFDRRFLNAASPGLIANGYLRGNEPVRVINATPQGVMSFQLPGLEPPRVFVQRRGGLEDMELETRLDTLIIDTDAMKLTLLWRGLLALRREPLELRHLRLECEGSRRWGFVPPEDDEDGE